MGSQRITTVTTYCLLALAGTVSFTLPDALPTASAVSGPATIRIKGIVRDFRESHPDFGVNIPCVTCSGHVARNVDLVLDVDDRPAWIGAGFKVDDQWRDGESHPIAPHLFGKGGGRGELAGFTGAATSGSISVTQGSKVTAAPGTTLFVATNDATTSKTIHVKNTNSVIDGDVFVGPGGDPGAQINLTFGGTITGTTGTLPYEVPFPTISVPDLGPSVGDRNYVNDATLSSDLHVDNLNLSNNAILTIDGALRIVCEQEFTLQNNCGVELLPGSTLDLYVLGNTGGKFIIENSARINTFLADAELVTIYYLGSGIIDMPNATRTYASIYAPDSKLWMYNQAYLQGNFVGKRLQLDNNCDFVAQGSFDGSTNGGVCGVPVADTAGIEGVASNGNVTSGSSFGEWYFDKMGKNLSRIHAITLTDNGTGVYEYLDNAFYPIDGQLLGDEGDLHNYNFTYTFSADFVFDACAGQFTEFQGADDAWMFIDSSLVMDLGGVLPGTEQHVPIDRLNLTDGETYRLTFFYAQRHSGSSSFRFRTNIPLVGEEQPRVVSGPFD